VTLAEKHAFNDFPKIVDILVVARIESAFIPHAKHGPSNGIMQVNHGPFEVSANVAAGVKLLREYYLMLGSVKAAIIAYNAGPGNYRKGNYQSKYWNKYKEHLDDYSNWYEGYASNDEPHSVEHDLALAGWPAVDLDLAVVLDSSDGLLLVEDRETRPHRNFPRDN